MSGTEQAAVCVQLSEEQIAMNNELAGIEAELKRIGLAFVSEGQKLIQDPVNSYLDSGSISAAALQVEKMVDRYRLLLAQQDDRRLQLEAFVVPLQAVQ